MRRIPFYALRQDLLPILEEVELDGPLQYVRTGNQLSPDFESFSYGHDLPGLGIATTETGSTCNSFLVTPAAQPVTVRTLDGIGGITRYLVDQLLNPDSVCFIPAGLWGGDILLAGIVDTVSDSAVAQGLMRRFNSAFKAKFTKIKMYRVGQHACAFLRAGKRLTGSAQSPSEFDLTDVAGP